MAETDQASDIPAADPDALDSLHTLPLSIIPLETAGLLKVQMIKNARLESVIEIFSDGTAGSGQVSSNELTQFFSDNGGALQRDIVMLDRLAMLESFDIYSLRIELRKLDIGFENYDALQISEKKRAELTDYMRAFTRPLMNRVYGGEDNEISDVSEILAMLTKPNREEAMRQLRAIADDLQIDILEVPQFLERYGDLFLSISYFRSCLDNLMKQVPVYLDWLNESLSSTQIANDPNQKRIVQEVDTQLNEISTSIVGRFEFFDLRSRDFWDDINADSFREFQKLITGHHTTIGAVLCGLAVKMDLWNQRFPSHGGGPTKRLEFTMSEIRPGLSRIMEIENRMGAAS
ncbi:MAG: hypothetical protein HOH65_14430 [Rhodospirillaceae bacterium]|jgi:hypothetical protein|nr:hypothetical protein [Rhodospirillaceae bacterium]